MKPEKMTYEQVLRQLESLPVMPDEAPSLEPMLEGMKRIGYDGYGFDPSRTIIVAGTNGKGSVSATLETLLYSAGERVGLYTSPHLVEITERFRIDGEDISRELFVKAYLRVLELVGDLRLSHFELLTLMAAWIFCSGEEVEPVHRLILEVGLGGSWDATNAIPHRNCVITPIGMDHEAILGGSIESIAKNKFGVVGPNSLVVHANLPGYIRRIAKSVERETRSRWVEVMPFQYSVIPAQPGQVEPEFQLRTSVGTASLALAGKRGAENSAIALTAFRELGFDPSAYLNCLKQVRWPGRMELLRIKIAAPCPVFLSGDHNPPGIRSLLELLPHYRRNHLHVLISVARDKDIEGILQPLFQLRQATFYLTRNPFRGGDLDQYGQWLKKAGGAWEDPAVGFQSVMERARPGDMILVTGSLYLIGHIKRLFGA